MAILQENIKKWLNERAISDHILDTFGIMYDGERLVIPVHDEQNRVLFYKYRRNPFSDKGPKYSYDSGSSMQLYGIQFLSNTHTVFICEGELDVLAMKTQGYIAVSTTGGSGSFNEEWSKYFINKKVFIIYDNDDAGIKGAIKVQQKIQWADIIWLPDRGGVNDITDYFVMGKDFMKLIAHAKNYYLPEELLRLNKFAEMIKLERRTSKFKKELDTLTDSFILPKLNSYKKKVLKGKSTSAGSAMKLAEAKSVPITNYVDFNTSMFARCLWHDDSNPSMYYYESTNKVYCFSCSEGGDVIDVVMNINDVKLKEALEIILGV